MGSLLVLAGWPAAEPPQGAWSGSIGGSTPVALAAIGGSGPRVVTATSADGRIRATFAGALVNRRELEEVVGRGAGAAPGRNDAALVARLYEGRGEQSVSALRGGFALAVLDVRRGRIVLARDQLGVVPLYYAAGRSHCAAATRLAALRAIPGIAGGPDVALVDVVVALGIVPAPATVYPGIRQICPGELLVWEPGRVRTQRYWHVRFPEARDDRRSVSRDAVRRIREQLDEAVRQQTAGAVTGLLLSEGLGASALLALTTAVDRRPASAVTVASRLDVAAHASAEALARRAGIEHAVVRPDVDWIATADASLAEHGAPLGGMETAMLADAIDHLAGRSRVILTGGGAEEVLGGGPSERAWAAADRYRTLPGLVREGLDVLAATGRPRAVARVVQIARRAPVEVFAERSLWLDADARRALYGPELRHMVEAGATRSALTALAADAVSAGATDARDVLYAMALAVGVPRAAMVLAAAAGPDGDVRLPLADHRVAQVAAAVPPRQRASVTRRARLLTRALANELPRELRRARHRQLVPGPDEWRTGSLRALLEETLAPDRVHELGLFDAEGVADLRAAHAAGAHHLGPVLWRLALVSRWLGRGVPADDHSSAPEATSDVMVSSS